jgi:subtilisin family serine protease
VQIASRRFIFVVAGLLFANAASAGGLIDPTLSQRLAAGAGPHEVIVTFKSPSDANALSGLGVNFVTLQQLSMAGALLTTSQVQTVSTWPSVESIYFNAALQYSNYNSGQITGGHFVHDTLGVKGLGSTIAVLDSGIDATHPDLAFGPKVIQNVKLVGDLGLFGFAGAIENVPNTDTSSGHGTHVAGTAGGTGMASANDARRPFAYAGIAPQASLIGLGAGEGLSILHALIGFEWVLANQQRYSIDIVTNSWGGGDGADFDPNNPINRASFEAYRRGIVVTFAASNSGPDEDTLNQYAIAPWVINVAAGTPTRDLADFSSRGVAGDFYKHPDVTAPGEDITSTRAPGTVVGALGPVVDPAHPEYTLYYHTISGTSMATPFVAGTAALLLAANPQLSPDQVEEILMQTADPMAGYAFHQVGAGHIDVREAVELAMTTPGERAAFLAGDTTWSSQGEWNAIADSDANLGYSGTWRVRSSAAATDGSYHELSAKKGGSLRALVTRSAFKLLFPTNPQGGVADVYVDGVKRDTVSFFSAAAGSGSAAFDGLGDGAHHVEVRAIQGNTYVDGLLIEGRLFPDDTQFVSESQTFTGTMGPSVENLEVDRFTIEVGSNVTTIGATLGWTGALDIDLYLLGPDGQQVASGATLANPETLEFSVKVPGTYTYEVTGFATLAASYTLTSTLARAVTP